MAILSRLRTAATTSALATAAAAAVVLGAVPAHAAAQGCSGNVCIFLGGNAGGTALVQGWARNTTFIGSLTLTGPGGLNWSQTGTWTGGKGNWADYSLQNAWSGTYCVTGVSNSTGYQGTACKTLS
ncbi:hypothetical protein AB0A63_11255 [Lentzea sp. NPDC042327]|uniref:hypothetical protein n=1 Tax=Lentzea sp. NPDC042327 TaxID=3154801 RepID=UPI0033D5AD25